MSQLNFANNKTCDILNHFSSQPAEGRPKKCCACNGKTGACKNCSCVKNNKRCTSCAPNFHKRCTNVDFVLASSQPICAPLVPQVKACPSSSICNYFSKSSIRCVKFIPKACRNDSAECFLEICDALTKNSCDINSWCKLLLMPHQ